MQNPTPPGWQPQPPPYPYSYPNPAMVKGAESARTVTLGMLNIIFGYLYVFVTLALFAGSSSALPIVDQGIVLMLGLAWAGLGLFIGGIALLRRSASGIGVTKSVFWVLLIALVFTFISTITQVPSRYFGQVIVAYLPFIFIFLFYPLIALTVVNKPAHELGL